MSESSKSLGAALVGVFTGAAAAAIIGGWFTTSVEKQKFEYSLFTEALKAQTPIDRLEKLHVLRDFGFIETRDLRSKITTMIAKAEGDKRVDVPQLPVPDIALPQATQQSTPTNEPATPASDWFAVMTSYNDKQLQMAQNDKARFITLLAANGQPNIPVNIYKTKISNSFAVTIGGLVTQVAANELTRLGKSIGLSKTAFPQRDRDWTLVE